jgi:hypothetical protein
MKTVLAMIYEYLDQNGNPAKFICDGHIDSVVFRDKCFRDYYVKPLVVRHQWQKIRKVSNKAKKKYIKITETVYLTAEEAGATPVTIGLITSQGLVSAIESRI